MKVNYERRGRGTPLVLLHGIGHRWQAWSPVLDQLAEHHDVIAIDLPGFGRSPGLPAGRAHDLDTSVRVLGEVFDELGVSGVHVAGNSLGGLLAVQLAAQGTVSSATALSPAGFWSSRDRARALRALRMIAAGARVPPVLTGAALRSARFRAGSVRLLYAHPERVDRRTAMGDLHAMRASTGFAPTMRAGRDFAWSGPQPRVPLTVAWGAADRILPPRQANRAAELLPGAHHVLLPGCGHVPMIDNPELVARTILDTARRG